MDKGSIINAIYQKKLPIFTHHPKGYLLMVIIKPYT